MKNVMLCMMILSLAQISQAQSTRYLVKFRNKDSNPFSLSSPAGYLSQRAINRRTRYSIGLDSTDLPVTPRYIDSVRLAGAVTILNPSKWLNQVSIQTSDASAIAKINSFPFVVSVSPIAARVSDNNDKPQKFRPEGSGNTLRVKEVTADYFNYGLSYNQVHIHNGEFLHNIGMRGQSMFISLFDAGFRSYTSLRAFDSVNAAGQVLGTWDFVAREPSVVEDDAHGMQCFSTIAANIPGQFMGTAPKASFFLFRSEDVATEYPIEEHNWVCAAERADSSGTDVISSSLGYNTFDNPAYNHTYADMNGNTTMAAIGADLAAKKGILVLNSAGNEGNSSWKYIITPADGDSVVAVGAVNINGQVAGFSSYGPTSDGQVKPDVSSVGAGTVIQTTSNTIATSNGTSFSCPNMAGLATCLWQAFPRFNNMNIIYALRQAGNIAATPNDRVGYGIPDMKKAVLILLKQAVTSSATLSNCRVTLNWSSQDVRGMKYEIERLLPGQATYIKVGEMAATGTDFSLPSQPYTFTNTIPSATLGTVSYRILQVIDTTAGGAGLLADYIDTVSIITTIPCQNTASIQDLVQLMPNPAQDRLTIEMNTVESVPNMVVRIVNATGQQVSSYQKVKGPGLTYIDIPVVHLPRGIYFISFFDNGKLLVTKELVKL
jgi:hypothetical protein